MTSPFIQNLYYYSTSPGAPFEFPFMPFEVTIHDNPWVCRSTDIYIYLSIYLIYSNIDIIGYNG